MRVNTWWYLAVVVQVLEVAPKTVGTLCICCHWSRMFRSDIRFLKHRSSIFRQSSNPVFGFSMMEQVRLCAVWPTEKWLGSSMIHIQGWKTVWICYCHALEQGCLFRSRITSNTSMLFLYSLPVRVRQHFWLERVIYSLCHPFSRDVLFRFLS